MWESLLYSPGQPRNPEGRIQRRVDDVFSAVMTINTLAPVFGELMGARSGALSRLPCAVTGDTSLGERRLGMNVSRLFRGPERELRPAWGHAH